MDMYGVGYSIIRINKDGNAGLYEYSFYNKMPEEVYIHEFLHSLERILQESEYDIPQLHDYAKYGYKEDFALGLREWYGDYMIQNIKSNNASEHVRIIQ